MNADRALDTAVATEVFARPYPRWISPAAWYPHYSTDLQAAFVVVAEMQRCGYWLALTSPFRPNGLWSARFTFHDRSGWNGCPDYEALARTPMEAICHAALGAVRDTQPSGATERKGAKGG